MTEFSSLLRLSSRFVLVLGLIFSVALQAQLLEPDLETDTAVCSLDTMAFQTGERLTYKAFYNLGLLWIGVGLVDFEVNGISEDGYDLHNIRATARNLRKYNWIYEVADTYQTYLHHLDLNPHRFLRSVNNDGYTKNIRYDFDRPGDRLYIHHMMRRGKMQRADEWVDISPCTFDVVSAFYYVRNLNYDEFETGQEVDFEVFIDGESYDAKIRYDGIEEVKTRLGRYRCHKVVPSLIEGGIFTEGDEVVVYATADRNKVPIYIEAGLSFGKMKIYLQDDENLTFESEARIR